MAILCERTFTWQSDTNIFLFYVQMKGLWLEWKGGNKEHEMGIGVLKQSCEAIATT